MIIRTVTLAALIASAWALPSWAIDLYAGSKPQSTKDTCQSYAAVLALAAKSDSRFPIETFDQLRTMELEFRKILTQVSGGNTSSHQHWTTAMERLTSNVYTLKRAYKDDITVWMQTVRNRTTLSDDIDAAIATLTGGPIETVLTSVHSINGSSYSEGHIVSVLALAGNGLNSATQLIAFNSAIKGQGGAINECAPGNQPGDYRYTAGVVQTNNFQLKFFDGSGYAILTLEEK